MAQKEEIHLQDPQNGVWIGKENFSLYYLGILEIQLAHTIILHLTPVSRRGDIITNSLRGSNVG